VEVVGFEVKGVSVGQQFREPFSDFVAVFFINANVDRHRGNFCGGFFVFAHDLNTPYTDKRVVMLNNFVTLELYQEY
jgi:hypothetical protein